MSQVPLIQGNKMYVTHINQYILIQVFLSHYQQYTYTYGIMPKPIMRHVNANSFQYCILYETEKRTTKMILCHRKIEHVNITN